MTGVKMLAFVGFILMAAGLLNGYQANRDMENKMEMFAAMTGPQLPRTSADGRVSFERISYDYSGLTMHVRLLVGADEVSPRMLRRQIRAARPAPFCDHPMFRALLDMGADVTFEISDRDNKRLLDVDLERDACSLA